MALEIELPDGTILEAPDDADPSAVAKAYLANQQSAKPPSFASRLMDQGKGFLRSQGLGARTVLEGGMDVLSPFADPIGLGLNAALPGDPFPASHSDNFSQLLTQVGLPEPQGAAEKFSNISGRMVTGMFAGAPIEKAITGAMGLAQGARGTVAATEAARQEAIKKATGPGARTLTEAGVPLDAGQRTGNVLLNRARSAFADNPTTAIPQARFTESQQRAYTRAILRTIGAEGDEATQTVMIEAKQRIGKVFDEVAQKSPAMFDDALQAGIAEKMDTASRLLKPDELKILQNQVDHILNGVGPDGAINGTRFNRAISDLGALTPRQDIGVIAASIEDDLLAALERSATPEARAALQTARQQWRSMRMIEPAIGHGTEKFISPLRLSNVMGQVRNRAMSIYGQGGDQGLVGLAEAGRRVLPEVLPQSGTAPRGLLQAPLRSLGSYPFYRPAQALLNRQPTVIPPLPSRMRPALPFLLGSGLQQE